MENNTLYCAITADIVDSKKMDTTQRFEIQNKLKQKLQESNNFYHAFLASKLDFSGGDRIQALFYSPIKAYEFFCLFRAEMDPIDFRFALGVGDWTIIMENSGTNAQDGTSYHNAARAFEKAHKENKGIVFDSNSEGDIIINVLMENEDRLFKDQSQQQKKIALLLSNLLGDHDSKRVNYRQGIQKEIANLLHSSAQNISQQIKRGKIYQQRELQATILLFMEKYFFQEGWIRK